MFSPACSACAIVLIFSAACLSAADSASAKLVIKFFGSPTCGECLKIKDGLLKPLSEKHAGKLDVQIFDIENSADFQTLVALEEKYGVKASSPQELFLPDTYLCSYDDIMKSGQALIERDLADPARWGHAAVAVDTTKAAQTIKQRFQQFAFVQILIAGLVDGVNPCAIATMIFLVSYLAVQKRRRNEVLLVGMSFTIAVFLTYLLLGVGAFEALSILKEFRWISLAVKWGAVAFAGVAALACFRDAIVYRKTGDVKDMINQLPKALKLRIHKVISGQLSSRSLVIGAIAMGFLVTLLEAVCTGQVYLPTIVLMTRQQGLRLTGWLYLIFYNFLFILPLLIVMVLAYFGMTWDKLAKATQKHMTLLKVLLGLMLLGLAVFLGISA